MLEKKDDALAPELLASVPVPAVAMPMGSVLVSVEPLVGVSDDAYVDSAIGGGVYFVPGRLTSGTGWMPVEAKAAAAEESEAAALEADVSVGCGAVMPMIVWGREQGGGKGFGYVP